MSLSEVLSGWMAVAIGPGSHAESFIWAATLCARRAGRSAEDRLLCKQEVLGSNPSRSTQPQAGGLYARVEAVRELVRQVRLPDLSRNRLDVVRHAPHLERPRAEIEEAPGGLRVPVPRLADRPGVHEQARPEREGHREMRVTQDDERRTGRPNDRLVHGPREDVFVVVPRAPMVHRDEAFRHCPAGAVFEIFEISDARGRQVNPRPSDRRGRELVEPGRVSADRTAIVIPADRTDLPIPQDLEDLVRPGDVAGQVAGDPDPIRPDPIHVGEDRLQRRQVRMDIREDGEAHRGPEGARPISASQYGARIVRQAVQREAESHDIWVRSLSPIGSPTMPKKLFLAYHWMPVGQFFAPTNPSSIGLPQFGHATIGWRKTSSDLRDKRDIPRRPRGPIHSRRGD